MSDWLTFVCLVGEVSILAKLDRVLLGTWITPFTLLAVPYTGLVGIAFLFAPRLGFIPLYMESVLVWMVGLLLFWLGGTIVFLACGRAISRAIRTRLIILYERRFEVSLLIIAWLAIAMMAIKLRLTVNSVGGIWGRGVESFAEQYGSGWVGHIMEFSKLLLIFFIGTARREKVFQSVTIVAIMLMMVPYQSKGSLMFPLMSGLIYRQLSGREAIQVTNAVILSGVICLLFVMTYFVGYGENVGIALFDIDNYLFLAQHFVKYVFAGVLSFGDVMREGIAVRESDRSVIFAPLLNLYAAVTSGNTVNIVTDYYTDMGIGGEQSNVHTLFGTLVMFLGYLGSLVYILMLSLILNVLFAVAVITRNCWVLAVFSLMAGGLVFGWFEFYYWTLTMFEVPVYGLILAFVVNRSVRRRRGFCSPAAI